MLHVCQFFEKKKTYGRTANLKTIDFIYKLVNRFQASEQYKPSTPINFQ